VPTGVALDNPRARLFEAADQILVRDGVSALTSRAVTAESGVAKGVLHRHFTDFDTFLLNLVLDHLDQLAQISQRLQVSTGTATVTANVTTALIEALTPDNLAIVTLVLSRDTLRNQLRETTPAGIPLLAELTAAVCDYLRAEAKLGRITSTADPTALALNAVGTAHLLFAGELGATPDRSGVEEVMASLLVGVERPTIS
jgi:AcrR family transcriptional regulator